MTDYKVPLDAMEWQAGPPGERYPKGSGIFMPADAPNGHKARACTPVVRVFVVEDVT